MRLAIVAVLLVAGVAAVWLLGLDAPQQHGRSGYAAETTVEEGGVADPQQPVLAVRAPSESGVDPDPDEPSPPLPSPTRSHPRDRAGSGQGSARIRILDGAGRPVFGARVIVILKRVPPQARAPGPLAHTDETGHSLLRGLEEGQIEKLLVMPPKGREDLARHTLPAWAGEDAVVTFPQGHTLSCVVHDHDGKPIPGASVMIRDPEFGDTGQLADASGRYRFIQLPEGSYEVRAQLGTKGTGLIRARAGGPEMVLKIDNRGRATIRIEGWRPGAFAARGRLSPDPLKGPNHVYLDIGTSDGTIVVQGANPDSVYTLWLGTRDGREVVYEQDLRIEGREIVVNPKPALNISGRLIAPPGAKVTAINVSNAGVFLKGKWVGTETYEVRGLPGGTWTIGAMGQCPDGRLSGYVQARAGGTADIELKLSR